jgi:hypothetical protein
MTMVTGFDWAGFPVTQVPPDVSWHVITSPLDGKKEKVVLFGPTIIPLTIH